MRDLGRSTVGRILGDAEVVTGDTVSVNP